MRGFCVLTSCARCNHFIELTTPEIMQQKLDYLHYNPAKAGIVEKPEDY